MPSQASDNLGITGLPLGGMTFYFILFCGWLEVWTLKGKRPSLLIAVTGGLEEQRASMIGTLCWRHAQSGTNPIIQGFAGCHYLICSSLIATSSSHATTI